jgi:hypothetical protein
MSSSTTTFYPPSSPHVEEFDACNVPSLVLGASAFSAFETVKTGSTKMSIKEKAYDIRSPIAKDGLQKAPKLTPKVTPKRTHDAGLVARSLEKEMDLQALRGNELFMGGGNSGV